MVDSITIIYVHFCVIIFLTRCIYLKVQSICKYTRIKFFSLIASRLLITLSYTNTDDKEVSGTHFKSSFFFRVVHLIAQQSVVMRTMCPVCISVYTGICWLRSQFLM